MTPPVSDSSSPGPSRPGAIPPLFGIAVVTLLGAVLRLYKLGTPALWFDEALSIHYAHVPVGELLHQLGRTDVNTPFYYLLLKAWTVLGGDSEFWLRLPSALAGILCIPVVHAMGRRLGGSGVGLLAALFLATSSIHIRYSQEARPYALMVLAAGIALWGLTRLMQGSGGVTVWSAYVVGTGVALHCHNTMVLLPALANLVALVWWLGSGRADRRFPWTWIGANALALAIWSPVLALAVRQATTVLQNTWMASSGLSEVTGTVTDTFVPATDGWWITLLVGGLVLYGAWIWRRQPVALLATLVFAAGVPVLSLAISFWRPILLTRTILWPTLPFYILLAAGCRAVRPRALAAALVLVLVGTQSGPIVGYYRQQRLEPWDRAAHYVADGLEAGDVILIHPWKARIAFDHYFEAGALPHTILGVRLDLPHGRDKGAGILTLDDVAAFARQHERVWLVLRNGAVRESGAVRRAVETVRGPGRTWSDRQLEVICFDRRVPSPAAE